MASASVLSHLLLPFSLLMLLLLLLQPTRSVAQTSSSPNITLGSTLDADGNSVWASPDGDFAFGFHPLKPDNDSLLLAIWFDKIPEKTVVWSANRDSPVRPGSRVELTRDGRLVLKDHTGQEIWTRAGAAYAAMLDTGNFVLVSNNSDFRWQSFDEPTDTILPTQVMDRGGKLSSRQSELDYSTGRFQLRLLRDGNLCLNTIGLPITDSAATDSAAYEAYWLSNTYQTGDKLVFNKSGDIYVVQTNGGKVTVTSAALTSAADFYQRATLGHDGVFWHYVRPKSGARNGGSSSGSESWTVAKFVPENICSAVVVKTGGSGACGFNSYCRQDPDGGPRCECPVGFSHLDPNDTGRGCRQDYVGPSCSPDGSPVPEALFTLETVPNINWPFNDYEHLEPRSEDECRKACLGDCLCAVAIYGGSGCWKKRLPLSNGRIEPTVKALIKVGKFDNSSQFPPPSSELRRQRNDRSTTRLVQWVLLGGSVFVNLVLLTAISLAVCFSYHKKLLQKTHRDPSMAAGGINLRSFSYKELEQATGKFQEQLGSGAFGTVYKGALPAVGGTKSAIAVKKLDNKVVQEGEKEFRTEMRAIGQTHHRNLVQLLGFCDEGPQHRLLVYEFMSNGSLASFLFGRSVKPDWNQRVQIAFGIARGLVYLHEECSTQIIHCDIKPQNILLDDCFTPRISDFGLAKLLHTDQTRTSTGIRGTRGYVAPEWFRSTPITAKVDVYSYGVLLLEIICCRRNVEPKVGDDEQTILTDWAYDCYRGGRLDVLVGDDAEAMSDGGRLERLVSVAVWCIQEEPSLRPSMKKVAQMLEGAVEASAVPPNPSSPFTSSIG